jgi:hypothetical protein
LAFATTAAQLLAEGMGLAGEDIRALGEEAEAESPLGEEREAVEDVGILGGGSGERRGWEKNGVLRRRRAVEVPVVKDSQKGCVLCE